MTRARHGLLALVVIPAAACQASRFLPVRIETLAPPIRVGEQAAPRAFVRGNALVFAPRDEATPGIVVDLLARTATPDARAPRIVASDRGGLRSLRSAEPNVAFELRGADGAQRLFAAFGAGLPFVVSPDAEDARGFDVAFDESRARLAWWSTTPNSEDALRVAVVDSSANMKSTRALVDEPSIFQASVAPIGPAAENAVVVGFESATSANAPHEVRLVRIGRNETGDLRASATKPVAPLLAWSRAPSVAGEASGGWLLFEGARRGEEDVPWIWLAPLDESGDVRREPAPWIPCEADGIRRSHARVVLVGRSAWVTWEERRGAQPPVVWCQPVIAR